MYWNIFEFLGWLVLVSFVGLTLYDIIKGIPTRWYSVKKDINSIVRIFLGLGVFLGFLVLVAATPSVLDFFIKEFNYELPYGMGPLYNFASYYWIFFIVFVSVYLAIKVFYINLLRFTNKEYEWERGRKEKERRDILEGKSKIKVLFNRIFRKEKHA